jgi:hypothetical protein
MNTARTNLPKLPIEYKRFLIKASLCTSGFMDPKKHGLIKPGNLGKLH